MNGDFVNGNEHYRTLNSVHKTQYYLKIIQKQIIYILVILEGIINQLREWEFKERVMICSFKVLNVCV